MGMRKLGYPRWPYRKAVKVACKSAAASQGAPRFPMAPIPSVSTVVGNQPSHVGLLIPSAQTQHFSFTCDTAAQVPIPPPEDTTQSVGRRGTAIVGSINGGGFPICQQVQQQEAPKTVSQELTKTARQELTPGPIPPLLITQGVPCTHCGKANALLQCSRCGVYYCSATCQAIAWSQHWKACKQQRPIRPVPTSAGSKGSMGLVRDADPLV